MNPIILISGNYNTFNEGWNGAGAYMCSGLYKSDTFKLPIYIGGSETIQYRIENQHIPNLNKNKHDNSIFQASWNKHIQQEGFVWWLLEFCLPEYSLIIEQKYLDLYRPFKDELGGFNIAHDAIASMKGMKHSPETLLKLSKNHANIKGVNNPMFGKRHTLESIKKNRESNQNLYKQGYVNPNFGKPIPDTQKQKISLANRDKTIYIFKNIETNEIFKGMKIDFRKKYNLQPTGIYDLVRGRLKSSQKWIVINQIGQNPQLQENAESHRAYNPET